MYCRTDNSHDRALARQEVSAKGNEIVASLYEEHEKALRSYVRRFVPRYEASYAEDVVQETFVRAIRHVQQGKAIGSPRGFLYKTARNLITSMFYRGPKRVGFEPMVDLDEAECALLADECSAEHRLTMEKTLEAFCVAVASLPERYQEAFVRRRVWGESCSEIADAMHLSEQAVSNYATQGWKLLLEYCEEHDIVLTETRKSR